MTMDNPFAVLWRRRVLFVMTFVLCMAAVAAVTLALPKVYRATATVFVDDKGSDLSPDQLVHTYSSLAANPSVADQVRATLPYAISRKDLLDDLSFTPIETSQLFEITAESSDARRAQITANAYARFFVRHVAGQVAQGGLSQRASLTEAASLPEHTSRPNFVISLGLGFLLSLFVAVAAVLLREFLDRRVQISGDSRSLMGIPIIGRIPPIGTNRNENSGRVDDAYRLLRLNLEQSDRPANVIAVTSPSAAEGKSTVAARLARAAAADGQSVVVVEGDLRRPQLARDLAAAGLSPGALGLTGYLAGTAVSPGVVVNEETGVAAVFAGPPLENPTGLLRSPRMQTLIDLLTERFDQVIIDTPPVPVGADASLLAGLAGSVLLVVDAQRTRTPELANALDQIRGIHARLLGIAVNNADVAHSSDSYYAPLREAAAERSAEESGQA